MRACAAWEELILLPAVSIHLMDREDDLEEERRLCYVDMTRAKEALDEFQN